MNLQVRMRTILIIGVFFIFGALLIISNNGLAMHRSENFSNFSELYGNWMEKIYSNVRTITGNTIGLDWWPSDSTENLE